MPRVIVRFALCLLLALVESKSAPPPKYYASADEKYGTELRQALHDSIKGHTVILYDCASNVDTVDALKVLDEDPANTDNVLLIYSGWSVPKSSYGVNGWNREHIWPNSYGFDINVTTTWPALRDLFNLRACDPADPNFKSIAHANAPLCSTDSDSWEPPDTMKGDIARALFYMAVRYAGDTSLEPELKLTDQLPLISSGASFMGRLTTLLRWHHQDAVDDQERIRYDRVLPCANTTGTRSSSIRNG